jgi:hypothetical protein
LRDGINATQQVHSLTSLINVEEGNFVFEDCFSRRDREGGGKGKTGYEGVGRKGKGSREQGKIMKTNTEEREGVGRKRKGIERKGSGRSRGEEREYACRWGW